MKLRKAQLHEANSIHEMYEAAKAIGKVKGNSDWDEHYPNIDIIIDDILSLRNIIGLMRLCILLESGPT